MFDWLLDYFRSNGKMTTELIQGEELKKARERHTRSLKLVVEQNRSIESTLEELRVIKEQVLEHATVTRETDNGTVKL